MKGRPGERTRRPDQGAPQLVDKEVGESQTTSSEQCLRRLRRCIFGPCRWVGGYPPPWGRGSQFGIRFRDQQGILGLPPAIEPAFTRRRHISRSEEHATLPSFLLLESTGPDSRCPMARQSTGRWGCGWRLPWRHRGGEGPKGLSNTPRGYVSAKGGKPKIPCPFAKGVWDLLPPFLPRLGTNHGGNSTQGYPPPDQNKAPFRAGNPERGFVNHLKARFRRR